MFAGPFHGSGTKELLQQDLADGCSSNAAGAENMKPSFTRKLKFQSVLEGETVELQCELVASPPLSILWFHNNKTLRKTRRRRIGSYSQMHMHTTSLVIDGVKEKDSGSYKVMAINSEGSAESTASLLVSMQEEQSANYLSRARRCAKAQDSMGASAEHRLERKFRVDLRCVGSPFDKVSKARLGRSRSETSLVRSVYFRSGCLSKEGASTERSRPLETASERALSPPPMFDRSERFNDRFSDIYCDRRTGARSSDRFSDTESLHSEVRTKLTTLQRAVQRRKRLSISTMSSSEFELDSATSESSYADYVERLRLRTAFQHEAPHFSRHLDLEDSQQDFHSRNVSSVASQSSVRHSFEPQSRARAIQIMRGELVDTMVDPNGEDYLQSQKDEVGVSKGHGAVTEEMMEDSFTPVKDPDPVAPHSETSFYPQTKVYPECAESGPVFILQEKEHLMESPSPKEVTALPAGFTEAAEPEGYVDARRTDLFQEETFRSPGDNGLETGVLEYEQIRKWQPRSEVTEKELSCQVTQHPHPEKRLVDNRRSVGPEDISDTKAKFGLPEAALTTKSHEIKASLLEEEARIQDREEEMESEAPGLFKQTSPRLNLRAAGQREELLPKGKAQKKGILGDSPRPGQHRSVKGRFLHEPELPAHVLSGSCEPCWEPCGAESLRADYGKSLEAERIQCEEKLLALRIRKWQQGMQMSDKETHHHEFDLQMGETSYVESESQINTQQTLQRSSAKQAESERPREAELTQKTGEGLHLSKDNISGLQHESERFLSGEEALAQRILKWQQDVLNEQEQAAPLESSRTGANPQTHTETIAETRGDVPESVPQLYVLCNQRSFSAKSAKEMFFMSEHSHEPQDQQNYCPEWPPAGQLQAETEEHAFQRGSGDSVKEGGAPAEDSNRPQDAIEGEHRAEVDSEGQQHRICNEPKSQSVSSDREDNLVRIAHEHYSVPSLSRSADANEALPIKSSILQHAAKCKPLTPSGSFSHPLTPSGSEDVRMEKRPKEAGDAAIAHKARTQRSRDETREKDKIDGISADRESQQRTFEGVSGMKSRVGRCEYGPKREETFVQESRELKEEVALAQKSKTTRDGDAAARGVAPAFVREISSLKARVGEMSEFTCQFHGDPLPTVTWLKDGRPLTHNPDFDIVNRADGSRLTVFYPTADHKGTYDCIITNKYGKALCSATLEIADKVVVKPPEQVVMTTALHKRGLKSESVLDKNEELSACVDSGKATLQVPQTAMHRRLCSDEGFGPSPVEIRITTATPVPGAEEDDEDKPQGRTEEMSTVAAADTSSGTIRHKFMFSTVEGGSPSSSYSESITGEAKTHQQHQDTAHEEEEKTPAQPEAAVRTKKPKHAVPRDHPGLSGCGLLASSAVIKVSEMKQAFESDSPAPLLATRQKDRKETAFPEDSIPAVVASTELKDPKGEPDPWYVERSTPKVSPVSEEPLAEGAEGDATQSAPASGASASTQLVLPQLAATTIVTTSKLFQPTSLEENSPETETGTGSTECRAKSLELVPESPELITPKKPGHSTQGESCETETRMSPHTFDRTSSFIPFLSDKEKRPGRTLALSQATLNPKKTSGGLKPKSQNEAVMSSTGDGRTDVVREAGDLEDLTEVEKFVKEQMKVDPDGTALTAALDQSEEASSASTEPFPKPEPSLDSGVFLSQPDTWPDSTKAAEETPGYGGEHHVLNSGAQESADVCGKSDSQPLLVNPKVADIPGQHSLSEDGAAENKVPSFVRSSETGAIIATVGSLEEEEVTFGAVYDYYNLPPDWGRPMSPESEMSIEVGSTVSDEITEVAERFFTPGSSTEVLPPVAESFHTPTSPLTFHTPTSVTPGGFVTPQEYPLNPNLNPKSPSSRESSERFFSPLELPSSPVEWSMETTAESSSLATIEEKGQGVPPAFLKPLIKKRVCENDPLTFLAEVFGLPSPEVKWFCNKTQLLEDDRVKIERDGDSISLTVLNVTKADQGEYICEAVNNVGQARSVALVVVVSQEMRLMPPPPAVTHQHVMEFDVEDDDTSRSPSPQEILLEVELDENEVREFEKQVKIITIPEYTADNKSMIVSLDVLPSIYEEGAVDFVSHEHDDLKIAFEVTEMPPRFINSICDVETPEGTTVLFECLLMGTPSPIVSWFKGDKKIPPNSKKYMQSSDGDNHFLKICTVTAQDGGVYVCRAINVVGETLCRASLVVVNAKDFAGRTRGREVTAVSLRSAKSEPQKFDLMVGGTSLDGEQVSEIELEFEFDQEADESQRAVRLVAKADHQSETSEQGEKYVSINFDVFAEPAKEEKVEFKGKSSDLCSFQFQVTESPPKFIVPLTNITAAVGTPVMLQCLVSGTPNPTAEWYKDGGRVTDHRCIIQEKTVGHFNLLITNVSQSDAGEYRCITQNAAGRTESAALLQVF